MRHLKRYFLLLLSVTVILSASFASPASAVDMSPNVHPIWANANPTCSFYVRNTDVWQNNMFSNNTTGASQTYSVSKINCDYPQGLNTVKTYAVYSFRFDNFAYDNSADSGWLASKIQSISGSADWGVIGQEVSSTGSTGWQLDLYLYSTKSSNGGTFQIFNPLYANEIFYLKPQERITFIGSSYWQVTTDTDFEYDYTSVLNQINTKLGNTNSGITSIRDSVNGISSKMDDLKSSQEQANQDANDRYQDEKDTIDNNASDAQDTTNNADFSFTVGNPLTTWLGLFTGSNCVSIPTIASWIHSNETSVCSPWSSSVRDVTTPIISVLSGTILFGFIVRWLNGSSFNESIEVG